MQRNSEQKTVILDSSVWIAYFRTQDTHHKRAVDVLQVYKNYLILLPEIVYFETLIGVYKVSSNISFVRGCMNLFKTHEKICICKINQSKIEKLIISHLELIKLKSSDFLILMYVINYQPKTLITFDKRLQREYNKIVINN